MVWQTCSSWQKCSTGNTLTREQCAAPQHCSLDIAGGSKSSVLKQKGRTYISFVVRFLRLPLVDFSISALAVCNLAIKPELYTICG
jgi:hypothetical protein